MDVLIRQFNNSIHLRRGGILEDARMEDKLDKIGNNQKIGI